MLISFIYNKFPAIAVATAIVLCLVQIYLHFSLTKISDCEHTPDKKASAIDIDNLKRRIVELKQQINNLAEFERLNLYNGSNYFRNTCSLLLPPFHERPPPIFFITPTAYRPAQKPDLVRLGQTLSKINNLCWIIVEDALAPSQFIGDLVSRLKIEGVHLTALTPPEWKTEYKDPNWKYPKGVAQRNTALNWIRLNVLNRSEGIVYFGDDDNVYDWRIFGEMRRIKRVGIWPVGIVGGSIAEYPILDENYSVVGFNTHWKSQRLFPVDMAAFALNISLILEQSEVYFTYRTSRGNLESQFLRSLNVSRLDLEPMANLCTRVLVWHTRTEKAQLTRREMAKFITKNGLDGVEKDAIL